MNYSMNYYRCFLLGREGDVRATEDIDATSKEDALAAARRIFDHRSHHSGFELWLDAKCVHIEPMERVRSLEATP